MEVGSGVEERDVTYSTEPHSVIRDARVSRDSILSALVVDWPLVESVLVDIGIVVYRGVKGFS